MSNLMISKFSQNRLKRKPFMKIYILINGIQEHENFRTSGSRKKPIGHRMSIERCLENRFRCTPRGTT